MGFDPVITNPGRLSILTALAAEGEPQEFVRLRRQTRLTDGNLASHAKRLRTAGLIAVDKRLEDGKPVTRYLLTGQGRAALMDHVRGLMAAVSLADESAIRQEPRAIRQDAVPEHVTPEIDVGDEWVD